MSNWLDAAAISAAANFFTELGSANDDKLAVNVGTIYENGYAVRM
jgi:hypothetical protein